MQDETANNAAILIPRTADPEIFNEVKTETKSKDTMSISSRSTIITDEVEALNNILRTDHLYIARDTQPLDANIYSQSPLKNFQLFHGDGERLGQLVDQTYASRHNMHKHFFDIQLCDPHARILLHCQTILSSTTKNICQISLGNGEKIGEVISNCTKTGICGFQNKLCNFQLKNSLGDIVLHILDSPPNAIEFNVLDSDEKRYAKIFVAPRSVNVMDYVLVCYRDSSTSVKGLVIGAILLMDSLFCNTKKLSF